MLWYRKLITNGNTNRCVVNSHAWNVLPRDKKFVFIWMKIFFGVNEPWFVGPEKDHTYRKAISINCWKARADSYPGLITDFLKYRKPVIISVGCKVFCQCRFVTCQRKFRENNCFGTIR